MARSKMRSGKKMQTSKQASWSKFPLRWPLTMSWLEARGIRRATSCRCLPKM
ncbi:unnamed protein product, partial [Durusdinium trenchii]